MLVLRVVKKSVRSLGIDLKLLKNTPSFTLCGLRNLDIRTILDIGANEGQFAMFARRHFPHARIISFEPLPAPFAKLQSLARHDRKLLPVNSALGAETGTRNFHLHTAHSPSSSFLATTCRKHELYPQTVSQEEVMVELNTLDGWAAGAVVALEPGLLVKLDVQGYEDRVIAGGAAVFAQAAACILEVNLDALYEGQASFDDLVQRMRAHGLGYAGNLSQAYAPDGHVVFLDAVFLRRSPAAQI
ncbi:MAG: FkbM family methyltransferase [Defluviicoccus sp.]|nr:FkbM family methyltransferase [Defluviicoccus sp.]MDG4594059.1 FkbM family methyltransferase [Defluviicoccus sp.]